MEGRRGFHGFPTVGIGVIDGFGDALIGDDAGKINEQLLAIYRFCSDDEKLVYAGDVAKNPAVLHISVADGFETFLRGGHGEIGNRGR